MASRGKISRIAETSRQAWFAFAISTARQRGGSWSPPHRGSHPCQSWRYCSPLSQICARRGPNSKEVLALFSGFCVAKPQKPPFPSPNSETDSRPFPPATHTLAYLSSQSLSFITRELDLISLAHLPGISLNLPESSYNVFLPMEMQSADQYVGECGEAG